MEGLDKLQQTDMTNQPIPPGWAMTTLEEVTAPRGLRIKPSEMQDSPFVGLEHIEAHTMRLLDMAKASEVKSSASYFGQGDVIYGRLRPYLNKVYMPDFSGLASGEFIVFARQPNLNNAYLKYFLNQWEFVSFVTRLNTGDRPRVDFTQFADYPFPLAPLPEQRRIVAEIETQFTRLDASAAALRRAQANLKRYRASVLKSAYEGSLVHTEAELARAEGREYESASVLLERILAERRARWESQDKRRGKYKEPSAPDATELPELPEGWLWATLEQLIWASPQNGLYKPKTEYGDGIPILRIDDFQDFFLKDREALQCLKITAEESAAYELHAGQLIINRVNSPSHLGKCLVVPDSLLPAVFESNMMRLTVHSSVDPAFVAYYLRSREGRSRLTANAKWAVNQASINQKDVCITAVPFPPEAEQHRIVAVVERQLSVIQQAEATVTASLARADRLRQSILKQAFSGQLVPQDPDDELASALLERIRDDREAAKAQAVKPLPRTRHRAKPRARR